MLLEQGRHQHFCSIDFEWVRCFFLHEKKQEKLYWVIQGSQNLNDICIVYRIVCLYIHTYIKRSESYLSDIRLNLIWLLILCRLVTERMLHTYIQRLTNLSSKRYLLTMRILERVQPFFTSFEFWDFFHGFSLSYVVLWRGL